MQKKKSKELRRPQSNKKKIVSKKITCAPCNMKLGLSVHIQEALQRKYSSQNLFYFLRIQTEIELRKKQPQKQQTQKQYLQNFYKRFQRRHQLHKIKQIYEHHKEAPRLFMPIITDILSKKHHRKRLLQYLKIAKVLGLKVTGGKTSTFLFSLSKTYRGESRKSFEHILGQISAYQFSEQVQKQLLESLEGKQITSLQSKLNPQIQFKIKQPRADKFLRPIK